MNLKKYEEYLKRATEIQNVRMVITDKEKVIFSYPENKLNFLISKEVKKIIEENKKITLENNVFNIENYSLKENKYIDGNLIELFVGENIEKARYTGQMVAPLCKNGKPIGSIIFYRDYNIQYPGKVFVKSKVPSIILTKQFLEEALERGDI